jgi:hypothetical protein
MKQNFIMVRCCTNVNSSPVRFSATLPSAAASKLGGLYPFGDAHSALQSTVAQQQTARGHKSGYLGKNTRRKWEGSRTKFLELMEATTGIVGR